MYVTSTNCLTVQTDSDSDSDSDSDNSELWQKKNLSVSPHM